MNDEETKAVSAFESARKVVLGQPTAAQGGKRAEVNYGEAYQNLVLLGLAPQIGGKYRL